MCLFLLHTHAACLQSDLILCWLIAFQPVRLPVCRFTMGIKAALPRYELYLYTAVLGVALIWAGSWIFEASSGECTTCHETSEAHTHL